MSHRRKAPILPQVIDGKEFKTMRRIVKKLVPMRLAYGKSTLFDSHTREPLYSIEVISDCLYKAVLRAAKCGEQLELSAEEAELWRQMFPGTGSNRSKPDRSL